MGEGDRESGKGKGEQKMKRGGRERWHGERKGKREGEREEGTDGRKEGGSEGGRKGRKKGGRRGGRERGRKRRVRESGREKGNGRRTQRERGKTQIGKCEKVTTTINGRASNLFTNPSQTLWPINLNSTTCHVFQPTHSQTPTATRVGE